MWVERRTAWFSLLLLSSVMVQTLGCAFGSQRVERNHDTVATSWHYEITLDDALTRLDAKVCFQGAVPRELRAGKDEAAARLLYARWLSPGAVRRLRIQAGRIQLLDDVESGCLGYGVSLAESGSLDAAVRRVGADLIASPNVWLWRPERRAAEARATLALHLPSKVEALLPWPEQAGMRVLDAEAFRFDSYAAFGRFERIQDREGTVYIEAALLDGELTIDRDATRRWLRAAVRLASLSDGQFPRERLSAIIVPSQTQSEPVPFGMVARGGSASVLLLVSPDANEAVLRRDWVLPHELGHLLLPFVEREHAWLSEGFATYYQEVLRARAGVSTEQAALTQIVSSLRAAASDDPGRSVIAESSRMHATQSYRKVYWGGAAYWLNVDVELRRRSHGHVSVDTVLEQLRSEDAQRAVWSLSKLIERLDQLAGSPVFSSALRDAKEQDFPPFEATLRALGVRDVDGAIELDDAAPLAELRRALFGAPNAVR